MSGRKWNPEDDIRQELLDEVNDITKSNLRVIHSEKKVENIEEREEAEAPPIPIHKKIILRIFGPLFQFEYEEDKPADK